MSYDWKDDVQHGPEKTAEEAFEELSLERRHAIIDRNDEEVREWRGKCVKCGRKIEGKLVEIRGKKCPGCGYGS